MKLIYLALLTSALSSHQINPKVLSGEAKFARNEKGLTVKTANNKTHILWERFSIPKEASVYFHQPDHLSAVLNQVLYDPTEILGSLESNGKLFFLNPNGILIGKDAKVRVGSFFAATHELKNPDAFFSGEPMQLAGGERAVVNLGSIEALHGSVFLLSTAVENAGTIEAKSGAICLGAADKILIQPSESEKFVIEMDAKELGSIENSGALIAEKISLRAKNNPYSVAIRHSGLIDATTISTEGGEVLLSAERGKTLVDKGAKILGENSHASATILGDEVLIAEDALISLSANSGGGSLFIGGGERGEDPLLQNAKKTTVEKGALLLADAGIEGDGGKIIVWSEEQTTFLGKASVTGGEKRGNGGFIEISGREGWVYQGEVDAQAENGEMGTFLIDPSNIQISNASTIGGSFNSENPDVFTPTLPTAMLNLDDLYSALDSANVIISTTSDENQPGIIEVTSNFDYTAQSPSVGNLTLNADYAILFSASFFYKGDPTNGNALTLNATDMVHFQAPFSLTDIALTAHTQIFNVQSEFTLNNSKSVAINVTDTACFLEGSNAFFHFSDSHGADIEATNTILFKGKAESSNSSFFNLTAPTITLINFEATEANSISLQ